MRRITIRVHANTLNAFTRLTHGADDVAKFLRATISTKMQFTFIHMIGIYGCTVFAASRDRRNQLETNHSLLELIFTWFQVVYCAHFLYFCLLPNFFSGNFDRMVYRARGNIEILVLLVKATHPLYAGLYISSTDSYTVVFHE